MKYTLKYVAEEEGYSGYLAEMPSVVTQADTLFELRDNIKEALESMLYILREKELEKPEIEGWENSDIMTIEL